MTAAWPAASGVIGRRLREIRASRGLSLRAAAELAGLSKSHLSMIERGERPIERLSSIAALATALRVAPCELFDEFPGGDLVRFLADDPGVLAAALGRHRDDGDGRCRGCAPAARRGRPAHPCYVRRAADQAAALRAPQRAGRAS